MISNNINNFILQLIDTSFSSLFDRNPINFRPQHEKGVQPIHRLLSNPTIAIQRIKPTLSRNAFLCGCLDFTEHEDIEHLIIGYGVKKGTGTNIHAIQHISGDGKSVSIPNSVLEDIKNRSQHDLHSEVIIFHNHPYSWLNDLFDNVPLPSLTDRMTMLTYKYLEPFQFIRSLLDLGRLRFYLGENGFVREFSAPALMHLLLNSQSIRGIK